MWVDGWVAKLGLLAIGLVTDCPAGVFEAGLVAMVFAGVGLLVVCCRAACCFNAAACLSAAAFLAASACLYASAWRSATILLYLMAACCASSTGGTNGSSL